MTISVIIPNYNHANFLDQRIESILNQTFQDFELIILDDCSTDESRGVIEKYRNCNKVSAIIYNETNSGSTFKQWEKGISLAKGEIIWIAESDDWCEYNFLEELLKGMQERGDCVLAFAQTCCVDIGNNIKWVTKWKNLKEHIEGKNFIRNYLVKGNTIVNASMAVFKKEAYFSVNKDFTTYKFAGDWLFWIEIAKQGDVFISGKMLNFFRKHDKDVSGKTNAAGGNFSEDLKILLYLRKSLLINNNLFRQLVFIKYQLFTNRKKRFSLATIRQVKKEFISMFETNWQARQYFLTMQLKDNLKKVVRPKKWL